VVDVLKDAYNACAFGAQRWLMESTPEGSFDAVVLGAEAMADRGLIEILEIRRESQSGSRRAVALRFKRTSDERLLSADEIGGIHLAEADAFSMKALRREAL
jgi:hypothetical protein